MKSTKKLINTFLLTAITSTTLIFPSFAATKKNINSVSINVVGNIQVEDVIGEEEIEISASGNHYSYDYYEATNAGFRWASDDTPTLKIYLISKSGNSRGFNPEMRA